ncbi:protein-glutamate O-methyltransferase CheR [Halobacillus yeomjeoni]|uniref:CheR family methyltransferase n=1 Tax=Halobacillus yeomjeoni TaxID=311194 RepID=UPI001CD2C9E2|nr:protein-glutamate O-methyltransferase CheR [Halobacillus yeomjeoni]MCA0983022.1 protein-glutamate O-methyltransferase CheR [Halobacillus yeomjeoni]
MTDGYVDFIRRFHIKTGIDLSLYKEAQMKRRLTTLRNKRGFAGFGDYFEALITNPHLLEELKERITINVSEFYRNKARFEVLENKILPVLLGQKRRLNIWSAACSTGEEPYTIAMILRSYLQPGQFKITATDLDTASLKKAEKGFYPKQQLKEVSQTAMNQYFEEETDGYKVVDEIKRSITFKQHNLLSEPYPAGFDLIVCRNVLIYFTEEAKQEVYMKFHRALNKEGFLFVGSSEQIFSPDRFGFALFDSFFYQKR